MMYVYTVFLNSLRAVEREGKKKKKSRVVSEWFCYEAENLPKKKKKIIIPFSPKRNINNQCEWWLKSYVELCFDLI